MEELSDSVFCNELILSNLTSFLGVAQLKACRQLNHLFYSFTTPLLSRTAKVTISVCRYNMYSISYQPLSWEEYFSSRVATLTSVPIMSLYIQSRAANNSPRSSFDDITSVISTTPTLTYLHADVEFGHVTDYQTFCNRIFHKGKHNISKMKVNFRMLSIRDSVPVGRMKLNICSNSVKEIDLVNFPCSKPWNDNDTKNLSDFLRMFVNLEKLVVTSSPHVVVKGLLDAINEVGVEFVLPKVKYLEVSLNNGSVVESAEVLERLQETSSILRLKCLTVCHVPESLFQELDNVIHTYRRINTSIKIK